MSHSTCLPALLILLSIAACDSDDAVRSHEPSTTPLRSPDAAASGIAWFDGSVDAAFSAAQAHDKPLLVYWGAEWCPYCQALRTTVFTRADFIEQSRFFIAVYLDGDLPGAQQWAATLNVSGYPTMVVLRPDRTEIARLSGGMDLTLYAGLLQEVLEDQRPSSDVLKTATTTVTAISAEDCRRLAYASWDMLARDHTQSAQLADRLTIAAARCPASQPVEQGRLALHALALALQPEVRRLEQGKAASAALSSRVHQLGIRLAEREQALELVDLLTALDAAVFQVVLGLDAQFATAFQRNWLAAMAAGAEDARRGKAEQLEMLASALKAMRALRADHLIAADADQTARRQVKQALDAAQDPYARGAIVNAARHVFAALGDDAAAYTLLEREIPKSTTPYYYMSALAALDEANARPEQALIWRAAAHAAARGTATRIQWGDAYVRGLIRLAPDEVSRIRQVALEVIAEVEQRESMRARTQTRLVRMLAALHAWADMPERRQVTLEIVKRIERVCDQTPPAAGDSRRCRELINM